MKIGIGGIATENSTFSGSKTTLDDFNITHGEDVPDRYPFLDNYDDMEFVPVLRAVALPGGRVDRQAYENIKFRFLDGLRAGMPWKGVYLDMHGAMLVDGMEDAEGDFIQQVRSVVGSGCLICASYDLHGNVSRRVMEYIDLLTAYRTAPHTDELETRHRAVDLLVNCLRRNLRPYKGYVRIPVMLPGEKTSTGWEPGASLYKEVPKSVQMDGIIDASLTVGYAWADEPRTGAAAVVIGTDASAVKGETERLATAYWDARDDFTFGVPTGSADEVIQMALDSKAKTVFISDSGDNPTAGGVGDVTHMLNKLIDTEAVESALYASIPDSEAVRYCQQLGVGTDVQLKLGGKLDAQFGEPLDIIGRIEVIKSLPRDEYNRALGGQTNLQVVVRVGGVRIIITEQRTPFHSMTQFEQLGINPLDHKLVVIKIGYLEPELKAAAPENLLALTPGAVNQVLEDLPYARLERPVYPLDRGMTWTPEAILLRYGG